MTSDASGLCGVYKQLADLNADTLRLCHERNWEGFAALNMHEAALLAQLQAFSPAQRMALHGARASWR